MFSDESHIYPDGFVNNQACRYLNSERPVPVIQKLLHSQKFTDWCGLSANRIYMAHILFWRCKLRECPHCSKWSLHWNEWQHLPWCLVLCKMVRSLILFCLHWNGWKLTLKTIFSHTVLSFHVQQDHLTFRLLTIYLGFVKQKVFKSCPSSIPELKQLVHDLIAPIHQETLANSFKKVYRSFYWTTMWRHSKFVKS